MSCENCEQAEAESKGIAYYRWDIANIGLIGCREHLREIFDVLNEAQRQKEKKSS